MGHNCVGYDSKRFFYVRIYIYGHYRVGVRFKAYVKYVKGKKDRNERRRAERKEEGWRRMMKYILEGRRTEMWERGQRREGHKGVEKD